MQSLRELQTRCRQAILAGDSDALSDLLRQHAESRGTGVSVYRNNARETFRLALAASYPIIAELVGSECFAGLAAKYVVAHPSTEPDLQTFGEHFPEFLDQCFTRSSYRYLVDVARLELATEQVLLQRETAPLDTDRLERIPARQLPESRLIPAPAVRLVASEFPILAIWRMHHHADAGPVSLDAGSSHVLVLRDSGDAVLHALSTVEYELADRLFRGYSIGRAFEYLSNASSLVALHAALARLLNLRVFVDIN
ncbi:MAG: DNA-binding domain-containing protein [Gammaproteobacteria bacterium]|jgi:hypothetical protein